MDSLHYSRRGKKLKQVARSWAGGGNEEKADAANALGIPIDDEWLDIELWPENWLAFEIMASCQWQWVSGMSSMRVGLEQDACWQLIYSHPAAPKGKLARWALFGLIAAGAAACVEVWSEAT